MKTAAIDKSRCTECGLCQEHCRFKAIDGYEVDPELCEGCGVCRLVCPSDAIAMVDRISGRAYVSRTRYGPMVHAELFPGEEASGKLVTLVREMARNLAESRKLGLVLIDGSPGIGCPVIASLAGANLALIITEPTLSGEHDLRRVLRTVEHFGVEPVVCIKQYDLNIESAGQIESLCSEMGVEIAGRLPFDTSVVEAMVQGRPVVELEGPASGAIKDLWRDLEPRL
jgi:MinD superfamily P-loop ATPase